MLKYVVTAKLNLSEESGFEGRFINEDGEVCYLSIYLSVNISVSIWKSTYIFPFYLFVSSGAQYVYYMSFYFCLVSGTLNHGTQRVYFRTKKNWFRHSYWRKRRRLGVLNHCRNCFMEGKFLGCDDSYWFNIPVIKSWQY